MEQIDNTEFRELLKQLRLQVQSALDALPTGGIKSLKLGRCSFDPAAGTFTFKLEGVLAGAKGKEAIRYGDLLKFDGAFGQPKKGLPPLGAVFKHSSGKIYRVTGANSTATKVIVEDMQGKQFLFKPEGVALMYARTKANDDARAGVAS